MGLGEKDHGGKVLFRTHGVEGASVEWGRLVELVSVRFLQCEVALPPHFWKSPSEGRHCA